MWRATWKGLLAHKIRMALTGLAVVLGVAFVAGTFVLTDTMRSVFDDLVTDASAGVDVFVRAEASFTSQATPGGSGRDTIDEALLAEVRQVDGVAVADGGVEGYAQIITPDGEPVTTTGAPTLGFSWSRPPLNPLELREGRAPEGPGEVVIDARTAADHDLALGAELTIATTSGLEPATLVGIAGFGEADNLAGATIAVFETTTAQTLFGLEGVYSSIEVAADDGVSPAELRERIEAVLPTGVEAVTGQDAVAEMTADIHEQLGFFTTALLVFAAVALFVGAFVIGNTFTIVVAQRTREFALLRAVGASNSQVVRSVVAEAAVVGTVASAVGVAGGVGLAIGLRSLLDAFGLSLPTGDLTIAPRTIVVAFIVGIGVTVGSALLPARRAARISPVAALREGTSPVVPSARLRSVLGAVALVAGLGLLALGLSGAVGQAPLLVGISALLSFVGIAMLAPLVVRPFSRVLGAPAARLGTPGTLARGNAARSPRRTAATGAALMIGLGLVAFTAIFAESMRESFDAIIGDEARADFMIATHQPNFVWFPPSVVEALRERDELGVVSEFRVGIAQREERMVWPVAIDPETFPQTVKFEILDGDLAALREGTVALDQRSAETNDLAVGDTYTVEFARVGERDLEIVAIYENGGIMDGGPVISLDAHDAYFVDRLVAYAFATIAPGVDAAEARAAAEDAIAAFPMVTLRDQAEFKAELIAEVNQLLGLVSALLGMAILIAVLGITNTLALSVFERTREIGLLRAVGMSRRQTRSMVRWEAVIVSIFGALLGIGIGLVFGTAIVRALSDQGFTELAIPVGQLVGFVIAAGVVGVVAAVFPARRAARLDVLEAITFE